MVLFLFSSVFSNESNSNSKRFSDLFIVGNGNFLSGIGMFTIDFNCSRFGFIRGCIFGSFFVDSDFDTEKVCVFPLPIILAESASSVAFDSFELLLEERLE